MPDNFSDGMGSTGDPNATPPGTDWEKEAKQNLQRYNGMNGKFQQLQNQYAALEGQHNAVASALTTANQKLLEQQGVFAELDTKYKGLALERDTFAGKHKDAEAAAATANMQLERLTLISTDAKYRDLLDFWPMVKDLPGSKEDFGKNLDLFAEKLSSRTQSAVQQKLTGATGASSPAAGTGHIDKDAAYAAVDKLISQGITSGPEYEAALNTWMAL